MQKRWQESARSEGKLDVLAETVTVLIEDPRARRESRGGGFSVAQSLADDGKRLRGTRSKLDVLAESVTVLIEDPRARRETRGGG